MSTKTNNSKNEKIQQQLTELEQRLLGELEQRLVNVGNTSSEKPTELLDLASDGELDYMSAVSAETGSDTVREIQQALRKLKEGTYGICDDCGEKIKKRRLRARPFANLCIRCKEAEERRRFAEEPRAYARGGTVPSGAEMEGSDSELSGEFQNVLRELENVELSDMV